MEKDTYIALLERFLRGETTPEEEHLLSERFRDRSSGDGWDTFVRQKWVEATDSTLSEEQKERMFRKIQRQISNRKVQANVPKRYVLRRVMRYVAVITLMISAGLGGHLYTRYTLSSLPARDYQVCAAKAQKASVVLPDGTKVWLNSDSEITYTNRYGDGERVV